MTLNTPVDPVEDEQYTSWALLIQTFLLIGTLWISYYLSLKEIRIIHETIISIFAGMIVGLIIRLSPGSTIQKLVTFNDAYFFNLLLPPIILNSGYEMQKETFFKNFGTILLFAFVGTFISAIVIGILVWILSFLGIDSLSLSLLDSIIFGTVLSATDPVTVLAVFQSLKVDPTLYSIIFGESILNDSVSIVLYETLKLYRHQDFHSFNIFHGILTFLLKFGVSLSIGILIGILCALMLKHSQLHQYSSIESCIITLMAYSSYFLSNGLSASGIVSLLFCGVILKHYAYDNMSLKTRRTTKYMFYVLAQLSENFIFVYLGLTLFTNTDLEYKLFFIFFTMLFMCLGRCFAIFPLSIFVNTLARYTNRINSIPQEHSVMLFWSGLRGAVAFALSTRLEGKNANAMMTTILVVVVISVVAFGASTVKMLELLDIPTDVNEEENVSDDEPNQKHWFISFDDRFLKPLFTRQKGQYALPHDHWHHENEHIENFKLIKMNKQTTENHSRNNSIDTVVAASSSDSNNKSSENIT